MCVEAFNACIHGTLHGGGNPVPPASTSPGGGKMTTLPQRFSINNNGVMSDCLVSGDAVTCTSVWETPPDWVDSWTGTVTGKLSGLTVTGTTTIDQKGHAPEDPSCIHDQHFSGPVTYVFSPDGTVTMREGPFQAKRDSYGSCSAPEDTSPVPATEGTANWSAIE
jgi:hypothetical protein